MKKEKTEKQQEQTRVDDMLLEMISPKIKEIEEKFSRGEGLTGEDINTLLLKSQYNHINHLDKRLDEVTADVSSLKGDFAVLEGKFAVLEGKFIGLEGKFVGLEGKFDGLRKDFKSLEVNIEYKIQRAINVNMRWSIGLIVFIVTALSLIDRFVK